jgi:hypothetical protein
VRARDEADLPSRVGEGNSNPFHQGTQQDSYSSPNSWPRFSSPTSTVANHLKRWRAKLWIAAERFGRRCSVLPRIQSF